MRAPAKLGIYIASTALLVPVAFLAHGTSSVGAALSPSTLSGRLPCLNGCRVAPGDTPENGLKKMVVTGYVSPMNVAPGQVAKFMVSSEQAHYTAQIVRLYNADPSPRGPGIQAVPVTAKVTYPGHHEDLPTGSYVKVANARALAGTGSFTITAWIAPTTVPGGVSNQLAQYWTPTFTDAPQGIVSKWSGKSGYGLFIDNNGSVGLWLGDGHHVIKTDARVAMHPWQPALPGAEAYMSPPAPSDLAQGIIPQGADVTKWYFVAASYNAATGKVLIVQHPQNNIPDRTRVTVQQTVAAHAVASTSSPLLLAAGWQASGASAPMGLYNGKIDNPRVYGQALDAAQLSQIESGSRPGGALASWDFSRGIPTDRVIDTQHGFDGVAVNLPTRGVTGHNFNGSVLDWTDPAARSQYDAMYFHDDDLGDARWPVAFTYRVPAGAASGVYAARLQAGSHVFWIPFFVTPPLGKATSSVAFLVPTFSYLAYGQTGNNSFGAPSSLTQYSRHDDGSGVAYDSRLRPITSQQPGMYAWQFIADTHLVGWLHERGIKVDIITDFDLQKQGVALLKRYRVVLTGSHPEYITEQEQDAFADYVHNGGRLMYMGGNGFYWVTGLGKSGTYTEIRRRDGTEYWQAAPGESILTTTGQEGGLWRFRGRPPQALVGVGFTAQGFTVGRPYHRMPDSFSPQASWVFKGIGRSQLIGDFSGLNEPGGAASEEIDRADFTVGSPENTLVLARADGFPRAYQYVVEEVNASDQLTGGQVNPLVYADMTLLRYTGGGAVFSTSSIGWCANLLVNGGNNTVGQVTENVLTTFDKPGPLPGS